MKTYKYRGYFIVDEPLDICEGETYRWRVKTDLVKGYIHEFGIFKTMRECKLWIDIHIQNMNL